MRRRSIVLTRSSSTILRIIGTTFANPETGTMLATSPSMFKSNVARSKFPFRVSLRFRCFKLADAWGGVDMSMSPGCVVGTEVGLIAHVAMWKSPYVKIRIPQMHRIEAVENVLDVVDHRLAHADCPQSGRITPVTLNVDAVGDFIGTYTT